MDTYILQCSSASKVSFSVFYLIKPKKNLGRYSITKNSKNEDDTNS